MSAPPITRGILLMLASSLLFAFMGGMAKEAMATLPVMQTVFFRALVSLIVLTPWMAYKKIPFFGVNRPWLLIRSAAGFTALVLSFYATALLHLADAAILNQTSVLFVALLSVVFLKEKVGWLLVTFILGAFLGAGFIVKPSFLVLNVPGLAGLASGFFASIAYVSIRRLHRTESFYTMVFAFSLFSTLGGLVLGAHDFRMPEGMEWAYLIGLGACGTVAQLFMSAAYHYGEASRISPYAFFGVIFSAILGFVFWNEVPDAWSVAGGVLIIACGAGIMRLKKSPLPLEDPKMEG